MKNIIILVLLFIFNTYAQDEVSTSIQGIVSDVGNIEMKYIYVHNIKDESNKSTKFFMIEIENASINKSYTVISLENNDTHITEFKFGPQGVHSYSFLYNSSFNESIKDFFEKYKDIQNISDNNEYTIYKTNSNEIKLVKNKRVPSSKIFVNKRVFLLNNNKFISPVFSEKYEFLGVELYKNEISEMDIMLQEEEKLVENYFLKIP